MTSKTLNYEYTGKGISVGSAKHRAFRVFRGAHPVADGLDVQLTNGDICIRIFNYLDKLEADIKALFSVTGIKEVTFTNPLPF